MIPTRLKSSGPRTASPRYPRCARTSAGTCSDSQTIDNSLALRVIDAKAQPAVHGGSSAFALSRQIA